MNETDKINHDFADIKSNVKNNSKNNKSLYLLFIIIILNLSLTLILVWKNAKFQIILKENNLENDNLKLEINKIKILSKNKIPYKGLQKISIYEEFMPHLNEIIKKRTFKPRLPLPKSIKCRPHLTKEELII